jgi:hypothetical protein
MITTIRIITIIMIMIMIMIIVVIIIIIIIIAIITTPPPPPLPSPSSPQTLFPRVALTLSRFALSSRSIARKVFTSAAQPTNQDTQHHQPPPIIRRLPRPGPHREN